MKDGEILEKKEIIESIAKRGNGSIYLGVVGAVRTGKSTFIKRFIENLVVPNITDEYEKKHCLDEIPQSAQGKTIMTTEPKFVPSNGAEVQVNEFKTNIKLVDCVGFVIPGSNGYEDEDGNPRMVKTPWFEESIPFIEAAEIGTEKVIKDHATIGIVITSDGSFGEVPRNSYLDAEAKVINELKERLDKINKQISNLISFISEGIAVEETRKKIKELENERESINAKIENSEQRERANKVAFETVKSISSTWNCMTFEEQRSIIEHLIDRVEIDNNKISIFYKIY